MLIISAFFIEKIKFLITLFINTIEWKTNLNQIISHELITQTAN